MYCATIPTGSLPPPSTTVDSEASVDASAVGSASSEAPCDACAVAVASGVAVSDSVEPLRDTTTIASNTTAITTAITTLLDEASLDELLTAAGTLAPGVLSGRFTTEVLWKLERVEGVEGTTNVDEAFFAVFLAGFLTALFFTAFLADFLTALFFTAFLADFLADFLTALFFTAFLAEVFFAVFFAVFLTATVLLLGLRFWVEIEIQF